MKKPTVDYSGFRLSRLGQTKFRHLLWLGGWIFYFAAYILTEKLIPYESCTPIHCTLDDKIPFCEYFVIFYVGWYVLVAGSLLYFALYNKKSFVNLQKYIIMTQVIAMAVYILFPNRQDLRPESFPRENIFTQVIAFLYSMDTCTNVCPSLHVAYSLGLISVWTKEKGISRWFKAVMVAVLIMVCLSTAFLKQHSVLDGVAAAAMCLVIEFILFRKRKTEEIQ